MTLDPYGVDLQLGDNGDLVLAPNGDLSTIAGPENCGQALRLRLRTAAGELPLHPEYGSDLDRRLIGKKAPDLPLALSQASTLMRQIIRTDRRFLAVKSIDAIALDPAATKIAVPATLVLAARDAIAVTNLAVPRGDEISTSDQLPSLDDLTGAPALDDLAFLADDPIDTDELPDLPTLLGEDLP